MWSIMVYPSCSCAVCSCAVWLMVACGGVCLQTAASPYTQGMEAAQEAGAELAKLTTKLTMQDDTGVAVSGEDGDGRDDGGFVYRNTGDGTGDAKIYTNDGNTHVVRLKIPWWVESSRQRH